MKRSVVSVLIICGTLGTAHADWMRTRKPYPGCELYHGTSRPSQRKHSKQQPYKIYYSDEACAILAYRDYFNPQTPDLVDLLEGKDFVCSFGYSTDPCERAKAVVAARREAQQALENRRIALEKAALARQKQEEHEAAVKEWTRAFFHWVLSTNRGRENLFRMYLNKGGLSAPGPRWFSSMEECLEGGQRIATHVSLEAKGFSWGCEPNSQSTFVRIATGQSHDETSGIPTAWIE